MKKALSIILLPAVLLLSGCGNDSSKAESKQAYNFTDSLDRTVEVSSTNKTVVISGSLAEVWQLAGGELYGVSNDAYNGHELELSDSVKNYGELKNPSAEALIADDVDFIILSGGIAGHVELEETLESAGMTVAYFDIEDFEDYLSVLKICTEITGKTDLYEQNGEAVRERVEAAVERSKGEESHEILLLRAFSTGVKVKDSDNMTGRMLSDLGCVNIADSDSSLLEELSLESIVLADPEYVFITTMGEDEEAAIAQYESELASNPAWQELTAVKNGEVHILPKDMFHYKPNNRWGEAYEYLEEILYDTE